MGAMMPCSACGGKGFRHLPPVYQATLDLLRKMGPTRPKFLAAIMRVNATAMNERLEYLRDVGLVTRDHATNAKGYIYAATVPL